MWIPQAIINMFTITKEVHDSLSTENAVLRAENTLLRQELTTAHSNFKWLSIRVNALEIERGSLFERAYGVKIAVPEIVQTNKSPALDMTPADIFGGDLFNDIGDELAKKHGLEIQPPQLGFPLVG
jgi:hypothetical protein